MSSNFKKAERIRTPIKLEIFGPPGAGKTWSALMLATEMGYKKIAFLDTEKSAALYSHRYDFDVAEIDSRLKGKEYVKEFVNLFEEAIESKEHDIVIVDSLTHAWDAVKDYVSDLGWKHTDWKFGTPLWNKIIKMILSSPKPVIICSRADYDDVLTEVEKNGKKTYSVQRFGLKADVRAKSDYEFTLVVSLDLDHKFKAVKDRTELFGDTMGISGAAIDMDKSIAIKIKNWQNAGTLVVSNYEKVTDKDFEVEEQLSQKSKSSLTKALDVKATTEIKTIINEGPLGKSTAAAKPVPTKEIVKEATKDMPEPPKTVANKVAQPSWAKEANQILLSIKNSTSLAKLKEFEKPLAAFIADNKLDEKSASHLNATFTQKLISLEVPF